MPGVLPTTRREPSASTSMSCVCRKDIEHVCSHDFSVGYDAQQTGDRNKGCAKVFQDVESSLGPHFIVHHDHSIFRVELDKPWMHLGTTCTHQRLLRFISGTRTSQMHLLFQSRHSVLKLSGGCQCFPCQLLAQSSLRVHVDASAPALPPEQPIDSHVCCYC